MRLKRPETAWKKRKLAHQEKIRLQEIELEKQKLLDQAGAHDSCREFRQCASDLLNSLLEMEPDNGKAFFYLAQIHARKQNWRLSREFHRKTLASEGLEPWIYAHSLVRIGTNRCRGRPVQRSPEELSSRSCQWKETLGNPGKKRNFF